VKLPDVDTVRQVLAPLAPLVAWGRHPFSSRHDDEPDFGGYAVQVAKLPDGTPVYAPLSSGRTRRYASLDDWRSRL
jgi:hypothetical protein